MMARSLIFLCFLVMSFQARALEIDERLTLRILKISDTRKTLLINRGTEDGLVEGNHAKFFVSAGVVARGVCIKVSPSRSVWSIYRLVNADFIVQDTVMNLKIAAPVKISQDETRMVVEEDVPVQVGNGDPATLGIPLADGANDLAPGMVEGVEQISREELAALRAMGSGNLRERNWELWLGLNFSSLSSKTDSGNAAAGEFTGGDVQSTFTLGGEYYFKDEREWWARFSPFGFVSNQRKGILSFSGGEQDDTVTEFGGGLNWHPWDVPSVVNEFIPFFTVSMALGNAVSRSENDSVAGSNRDARGSTFSRSIGAGFKFYTHRGFGARAVLDYYLRDDKLKEDGATNTTNLTWTRTNVGPRLWVGLSYRW